MSYGDHSPEEVREALSKLRKNELKQVIKEAIKEWLDEQATILGKWSFRFMASSAIAALAYFILTNNGWQR